MYIYTYVHMHVYEREKEISFLSFSQACVHSIYTQLSDGRSDFILNAILAQVNLPHALVQGASLVWGPIPLPKPIPSSPSVPKFRTTELCVLFTRHKLQVNPAWTKRGPVTCAHLCLSSLPQPRDQGGLHRQPLDQRFPASTVSTLVAG